MSIKRTSIHSLFCERLKEQRKKQGLTQDEIAQELGIAKRTYQKWEAGDSQPEVLILSLLCDKLDCDFNYLVGKISTPHNNRTIEEITGLSYEAIDTLKFLQNSIKKHPYARSVNALKALNFLLEEDKLGFFFSLVGEYLFHNYTYIKSDDGRKYGSVNIHDEVSDYLMVFNVEKMNDLNLFHIQNLLKEYRDHDTQPKSQKED